MIVGRAKEQEMLGRVYQSQEAEFVVMYGRRRIGKTFLVREFYQNKKCHFLHATGLQKGGLHAQLEKFAEALSKTFFNNAPLRPAESWSEAFRLLHQQIINTKEKVVIFLDELPWMATKKSGLLQEIDYFWNHDWCGIPNVILILCGSSASWLIQKVIYDKGGLHNRVTCQINLSPLTLSETDAYLKNKKIKLNHRHVLSLYMAFGGVPYYLKYVEPGLSAEQNIQEIIFDKESQLRDEFDKLFNSLFKNADAYIELVRLIGKKEEGLSRVELKDVAQLSKDGGRLTKRLKDLCDTGFIEEYIPWDKNIGEYYKLIDEFCLFYLHWVERHKNKKFLPTHWIDQSQRPAFHAWSGYAFEAVCAKHVEQIVHALKVKAMYAGAWRFTPRTKMEDGAQIDLVIDRSDNAMTVCEIKYTNKPFAIDKQYAEKLKHKIAVFKKKTNTKKQIFLSMISANGLEKTIYSEDMVDGVVTLDDLFV